MIKDPYGIDMDSLKVDTSKHNIYTPPHINWEMAPTGDYYSLTIHIHKAPNWFHRIMQRLILGIKYRKIDVQKSTKQ